MLKTVIDMHILVFQSSENKLIESSVLSINGRNRKKLDND